MKKVDFNGNDFWVERRDKTQLSISPEGYEVILDRDTAKWFGDLLILFAATGRLTRRGK